MNPLNNSPRTGDRTTRTEPLRRGRRSAGLLALATIAPALAVGLATTVATAPAAQAAPGCTTTQLVSTCTFHYTGQSQEWQVPDGVQEATFTVVGAAGGNAGGRPGGKGGGVSATLPLTPGTIYQVNVGGKGGNDTDPTNPGVGGWNGGARGGGLADPKGGGGGGASDIRTYPYNPSDRKLVGGGGGGAGSDITYINAPHGIPGAGGNGGGTGDGHQGGNVSGSWVGAGGGAGGTATGPGGGGGPSSPADFLYNGCGFWDPAYPAGGAGGVTTTGGAGGFLYSASGRRCDQFRGWGGGGGGGWRGGGGGGGGITAGAGGGGGSGHAPAGSTTSQGSYGATGLITITYSAWTSVSGTSTMTSAPTVAPRPTAPGQPDQHDVFYLDQNSQVIQRVVTNGVAGPEHNLGAVLSPGSTVAAAWRPDGQRLDLFGRGTENALWQKTFTWAGGWGAWHPVAGTLPLISDPTAVSTANNQVQIFYRKADEVRLERVRLVDGQPVYRAGVNGSSRMVTGPTAAALPDGRIRVYFDSQIEGASYPGSVHLASGR